MGKSLFISNSTWERIIWDKNLVGLIIVAVIFFLAYLAYREPAVKIDSNAFRLRAVFYGVNIPFTEIAEADTIAQHKMPAISMRTNGISLLGVRRGHFKTKDGDKIRLSISGKTSPVIRIIDQQGTAYYINRKNADETRHVFNKLSINYK